MTDLVYLLLGNGFEELEAVSCMDVLRRGGVELIIAGVCDYSVCGAHGVKVAADILMKDIDIKKVEMLILPGGHVNAAGNFGSEPEAEKLLRTVRDAGIPIAAICAAPYVLDRLGLIDGKRCTCYPDMGSYLKGAHFIKDKKVFIDGNLLTGQGPGAAITFCLTVLAFLKDKDTAKRVRAEMYYSCDD